MYRIEVHCEIQSMPDQEVPDIFLDTQEQAEARFDELVKNYSAILNAKRTTGSAMILLFHTDDVTGGGRCEKTATIKRPPTSSSAEVKVY